MTRSSLRPSRLGSIVLTGLLAIAVSPPEAQTQPAAGSREELVVPFTGGPAAATTSEEYAGERWLCVAGTGQAAGGQRSDAFFVYTTGSGTPLPPPGVLGTNTRSPWHSPLLYNWVLWINGEHAEEFVIPFAVSTIDPDGTVPAYSPEHEYVFPIDAPGGPLTFGIGDIGTFDNTGSYTIVIADTREGLDCGPPVRCPEPTIVGTNGDDVLEGTNGPDVIDGRGGNDRIRGLDGNDIICGGSGRDRIDGGPGRDTIFGEDGNDRIKGRADDDVVDGGDGHDRIDGGRGNDTLGGGPGRDRIRGQRGDDDIAGGPDGDRLAGGPGNDTLDGGDGTDRIKGQRGIDTCTNGERLRGCEL